MVPRWPLGAGWQLPGNSSLEKVLFIGVENYHFAPAARSRSLPTPAGLPELGKVAAQPAQGSATSVLKPQTLLSWGHGNEEGSSTLELHDDGFRVPATTHSTGPGGSHCGVFLPLPGWMAELGAEVAFRLRFPTFNSPFPILFFESTRRSPETLGETRP